MSEAIAEKTGIEIPKERLRQFAMGHPHRTKPGVRHWPELSTSRLSAVIQYVTDDEDPASPLRKVDLKHFQPDQQAPFYLLEYLRGSTDEVSTLDFSKINGSYVAERKDLNPAALYMLTISGNLLDKAAHVVLTEYRFTLDKVEKANKESLSKISRRPDNTQFYEGWLLATPEDSLLAIVRTGPA